MEENVKEKLRIRDPKKAWDRLQAVLLYDDDLTVDELDEELRECGIDPHDSIKRIFEVARTISRESHSGGGVSPHVSEILSQLAVKYYEYAAEKAAPQRSIRKTAKVHFDSDNSRARVLSYNRNFKEESENDRKIREGNEERLRQKAEKLTQKKISRKK
jgi:hypothetical protein